jgi:cyclic nucleotide gated channel beta 1
MIDNDIKLLKFSSYVHSYFFGLRTASTIGNYVQPITKYEYLFTAIAYVVALFLFALIVGQIRQIIASLSTKQDNFLIVLDTTMKYIKRLNLSDELKAKTILWFDFYSRQHINQVPFEAISFLPINVQTDLAINIYYDLLSKVKLFQVRKT